VRSLLVITMWVLAVGWGVASLRGDEADAAEATSLAQPGEIASIAIDGRGVPVNELRERLASKPGAAVNDATLARDREAMRTLLVTRGYLSAQVAAPQISRDARGAAFVTFAVTMGPLYHVRSVELAGMSPRDTGVITIGKGDPAETDRIARACQAIADRLKARGKPASVTVQLHSDAAAAVVDVVLAATRSPE
jgi:outer membrane protein assembly factor BamA